MNIQEARTVRVVLRSRVEESLESEQILCGIDSRVTLGCWVKGRSSSVWLNQIIQGSLGWQILGRKTLHPFWVPTDKNYGDHPSRDRPVPPPTIPAEGLSPLAVPERSAPRTKRGLTARSCLGLEVFSGEGLLTVNLQVAGFEMD